MSKREEQAEWRHRRAVRVATDAHAAAHPPAAPAPGAPLTGWRRWVHRQLPGLLNGRGEWHGLHRQVRAYYAPAVRPVGAWLRVLAAPPVVAAPPAPVAAPPADPPARPRRARKPPAGQQRADPMPPGGYEFGDPRLLAGLLAFAEAQQRAWLEDAERQGYRIPGKQYPPAAVPAAPRPKRPPKPRGPVRVAAYTREGVPVERHTRRKPGTGGTDAR